MPDITVRGAGIPSKSVNIMMIDYFSNSLVVDEEATEEVVHPGMYRHTETDLPASTYWLLVVEQSSGNVHGRWLVKTGTDDTIVYTGLEIPLNYNLSIDSHLVSAQYTGTEILDVITAGNKITLRRGNSVTFSVSSIGDLTNAVEVWFVGRKYATTGIGEETIKVSLTGGLLVAGSVTASPTAAVQSSHASLTITDPATGVIQVALTSEAAALMETFKEGTWAVQYRLSDGTVSEPQEGEFQVNRDVVRESS